MTYRGNAFLLIILVAMFKQMFGNEVLVNKSYVESMSNKIKYKGEHFSIKYLTPEETAPTMQDLNYYLNRLKRTMRYFAKYPNRTDVNRAIGIYFMKVTLKKTVQDERQNLETHHIDALRNLIHMGEYVVSHYTHHLRQYGWRDDEFRVSKLFETDEAFVHSIREFNKNGLEKWIHSDEYMNEFVEVIDNFSLPKEKYVALTMDMKDHHISIMDSDMCMSRVAYNHIPIDLWKLQPCKPDPYCRARILESPSVAYALSHRMLNVLGPRFFRRCSMVSAEHDEKHLDMLCAFMYREAVYLARRGYFARDMFLEQITLCSFLGYEEFHRRNWFYKATSWMDDDGCIKENLNLVINRTRLRIGAPNVTPKKIVKFRKSLLEYKLNDCENHPMALLVSVLAHAIRHAAHFMVKEGSGPSS